MQKRILILGGYGNVGFLIARLLLQESEVQLVLAGRDLTRAQQAADQLNHEFEGDRVLGMFVDAAKTRLLESVLKDVSMVVVASSTIHCARNVAITALHAGIDYLDVQLSSPLKLAVLNALCQDIENQERCFITDGGYHPGLPAAMVRYAATQFDQLEIANISTIFQLNWQELRLSESTTSEFMDELIHFNPLIFREQRWIESSLQDLPRFDFGEPFGQRYCSPLFIEELRSLPKAIPSLHELGFYVAGFNRLTDYMILPIVFVTSKIFRGAAQVPMRKLFVWGLRRFSQPPFGVVIQLQSIGWKNMQPTSMQLRLMHQDSYFLTAVSAVACLLQYLNESIRRPGVWFQANVVEPVQFFEDIERLGIRVELQMEQSDVSTSYSSEL